MKYLKRLSISLVLFVITFFVVDMYLFRGYFVPSIIDNVKWKYYKAFNIDLNDIEGFKEFKPKRLKVVVAKDKENYSLNFKSNTIQPFLVWSYRNDKIIYKVTDSLFQEHYRIKINTPKYVSEYEYSICGPAGIFSITPFESFSSTITHQEIINETSWYQHHIYNRRNDTIMDLIYDKPLFIKNYKNHNLKVLNRTDITNKDSIKIGFYIPAFSYNHEKLYYITSNEIKISYLEIIKRIIRTKKIALNAPL